MPFSPVAAALVLAALALPLSIAASNVALALLAAALLARAGSAGGRIAAAWRREPALGALFLYAAAGLTAAALSSAPGTSLHDAAKDIHRIWSLGLFVAGLAVEPGAPVLEALAVSLAAAATIGGGQSIFGGLQHGMMVRAHAFVHPVVFGEQMTLAALGAAAFLLRPDELSPRARRWAAIFGALTFAALVLSQTRMCVFAAAAGFFVVALLEPRARRWFVPLLVILAIVALTWEFLPNGGRSLSAVVKTGAAGPQQDRFALWDAAWRMFRDHPATGVGPSGYHRYFSTYHPGILDGETDWGSAHNLYLHQLAERGILGAAALLLLLATLSWRCTRAALRSTDARALWSSASIAAFLVMCMTETSFQNEQFASLLLLVFALGTNRLRTSGENL
ncbi:MAG TPA: O-antigen ligase family protein [Elusimicrobiota bacterium]|nr:O-antigen ligase family protein [Elusimicrobiota bacterium]